MDEKILLDVEIKNSEALKALTDLKKQANELRAEQKKLDTTTAEGQKQYEVYAQKIKAVNAAASEQSKIIQNGIKQQNQQKDSLAQMSARLTELKTKYRDLSADDRNSPFGQEKLKEIDDLNSKLKEAEEAYGSFGRNVGNYMEAAEAVQKSLSSELGELTEQLARMAANGEKNTDQYNELIKKAGEMKQAVDGVNQEIDRYGKGTTKIEGVVQSMNAAVGVVGSLAASMKVLGFESEALENIQNSMQELMVIMQGLKTVQEAFNKTSAAYVLIQKAATVAQKLWNAAMAANPVGLLVAGITALIGVVGGLIAIFRSSSAETDKATQAQERYAAVAEKTAKAVEATNAREYNATTKRKVALQEEILKLMQAGATDEEIAEARAKADEDLTKAKIEASKKREAEYRKEFKSIDGNCVNKSVYTFSLHKKYSYLCISSEKGRF